MVFVQSSISQFAVDILCNMSFFDNFFKNFGTFKKKIRRRSRRINFCNYACKYNYSISTIIES